MKADSVLAPGEGTLHLFRRLADDAPLHPFLTVDGESITRGEFLRAVSMWAGAMMRQGVTVGDAVAMIAPNGIDWCVAFWAAVSLGARPVPLDPQIGAWELENLFAAVSVKLCLAVSRFRSSDVATNLLDFAARTRAAPVMVCLDRDRTGMMSRAEFLRDAPLLPIPYRPVASDEWLMLACTSGTTGDPKIIAVPHLGFLQSQMDMAEVLGLGPSDRMLLGMPLFHQGGFGMGLQALVAGAQASYQSVFDPQRFLATLEQQGITVVQLSSTLAKILLSHPQFDRFDVRCLRLCYFAGEVLPDEIAARFWRDRHKRVVNVIGSSETATMVMWDSARDAERSASEFCPLAFTQIRVGGPNSTDRDPTEPGSLWVSTDALLLEYYANPVETAKRLVELEGTRWFDTQDLVLSLPDGYVRFVGRRKRAIKRGPNLVHPEELEAFLLTHAEVAAVAVVRAEHELYGESILAWVQPAEGSELSRGALLEYCRGRIAAYKVPDQFIVASELPVDIGKIEYKRLRSKAQPS